jgi:hypothetical protein
MSFLFDVICTLVSLVFLGIVGMIPGLFMAVAAPWLDWIIPVDRKS